LLRTAAIAD
jgi:P-type E1-E2 ATPase